ncbi:FAD-dependent oxidoreductase, partial [Listeria fleischmannii]
PAGQLNGTSGEEAAGQGLMAGINACRKVQNKEPIILGRDEAYIGVLIDDLVTKGTEEPYRLLTSRAEYRLLLRHDNADLRLTEIGHEIGLISDERYARFLQKKAEIEEEIKRLQKTRIKPTEEVQSMLRDLGSAELKDGILAADFLRRPELTYEKIAQIVSRETPLSPEVAEQVEIQIKYEGYIEKSYQQVEKMKRMEDKKIPDKIDYDAIFGLATEAVEKLKKIQPLSIAQASRISGVNPADISILLVYIEQGKIAKVK